MVPDILFVVTIFLLSFFGPVRWVVGFWVGIGNETERGISDRDRVGFRSEVGESIIVGFGGNRHGIVKGTYFTDTESADFGEDPEFGTSHDREPLVARCSIVEGVGRVIEDPEKVGEIDRSDFVEHECSFEG